MICLQEWKMYIGYKTMDLKKTSHLAVKLPFFYLKKKNERTYVIFNNCKFGVMDTLVVMLLNFLKISKF